MKKATFIFFISTLLLNCTVFRSGNRIEDIHFVVLETNMQEVNTQQKKLLDYRPSGIELPDYYEDLAPPKPWESTFWYREEEGKPRKFAVFNSPSDTVGLNVVEFHEPNHKPPKSGLGVTVNGLGDHYCLLVRQFLNYSEADKYIRLIRRKNIIDKKQIIFPVPKNDFHLLQKEKEYEYYKKEYN